MLFRKLKTSENTTHKKACVGLQSNLKKRGGSVPTLNPPGAPWRQACISVLDESMTEKRENCTGFGHRTLIGVGGKNLYILC